MNELREIFNISNKTILLTGACGYFGKFIAQTFLDVGAKVILLSRSEKLNELVETHRKTYGEGMVHGYCVDFYDRDLLDDILKELVNDFNIDVVINNAYDMSDITGFNTVHGFLENLDWEQWSTAFQSGVYWAFRITQFVGAKMKDRRFGSIINIGSMYSIVSPSPMLYENEKFYNPATYTTMKTALLGFTRYVASFWGEFGIRCNIILPGTFPNCLTKHSPAFIKKLTNKTPLKRVGQLSDLAGALIFLASDASSYMTGQSICIDGGWTIT